MIKVPRNNVPIPECLRTDKVTEGTIETQEAIDFFQARAARRIAGAAHDTSSSVLLETKFKFKVYGKAKAALRTLFHEKCGYCEIGYGGAAREVEHYRPVGRIDYMYLGEKRIHLEGYYWLGAAWDNLILACSHCNKLETHLHQDQAHAASSLRVSGKGNFFTLEDEATRARPLGSVENERPLLLDPCRDNPNDHLVFRDDGIVVPKVIEGRASKRGQESIRVYGLRRLELVEMRMEVARTLSLAITRLNEQVALLKENPRDRIARAELAAAFANIRENYLIPKRPFLALSLTLFRQAVNLEEIRALLAAR